MSESEDNLVEVTFTFTMSESDFRVRMGTDAGGGGARGITCESVAADVILNHPAEYGYIHWKVKP